MQPQRGGVVYLLHFNAPISPKHTTQHYTGWCYDLPSRVGMHLHGRGARLTQVAHERGIGFQIVRTWPGSRSFERQIKRRKNAPRYCPICQRTRQQDQPRLTELDELL